MKQMYISQCATAKDTDKQTVREHSLATLALIQSRDYLLAALACKGERGHRETNNQRTKKRAREE